jgi:hypothetical protein
MCILVAGTGFEPAHLWVMSPAPYQTWLPRSSPTESRTLSPEMKVPDASRRRWRSRGRSPWSLRSDSNGRPSPYRGDALPLELRRHGPAKFPNGHPEPPAGLEPATFSVQASCADPVAPRRHGALGGIRSRSVWHLGLASLPCWSTSTRSLWTVSNRLPPMYEIGALPGELQRRGCRARTRTSIDCLPVASLPRGAPPEARTPFPGVRAQCITRHACGAWSGVGESNLHSRFGGPAL